MHFLGPVAPLLTDPTVSEVMINGPEQIYFERRGVLYAWEGGKFADEKALLADGREELARRFAADGTHHCSSMSRKPVV